MAAGCRRRRIMDPSLSGGFCNLQASHPTLFIRPAYWTEVQPRARLGRLARRDSRKAMATERTRNFRFYLHEHARCGLHYRPFTWVLLLALCRSWLADRERDRFLEGIEKLVQPELLETRAAPPEILRKKGFISRDTESRILIREIRTRKKVSFSPMKRVVGCRLEPVDRAPGPPQYPFVDNGRIFGAVARPLGIPSPGMDRLQSPWKTNGQLPH